jgi:hypothetical protein
MLDDDEWEARWQERERKQAEALAAYRQRHVETVYRALILKTALQPWQARIASEAAIDALLEDGVVFAYMGSCEVGECE